MIQYFFTMFSANRLIIVKQCLKSDFSWLVSGAQWEGIEWNAQGHGRKPNKVGRQEGLICAYRRFVGNV